MSNWKPREEYQTLREKHEPILVRNKCRYDTNPMVVIWSQHDGGHFYPCPGVPMFYGDKKSGFMTNDHFDEWMEIPQ